MDLPTDILNLIFNHLPIIDQRNWIKCCKQINQLYPLLKKSRKNFLKLIHESGFICDKKIDLNECEKYVLEYIYYDRENIPEKYFLEESKNLFTRYSKLYYNIGARHLNICVKLCEKYSGKTHSQSLMNGAANVGNLKTLKWLHNYCRINIYTCFFAASGNQVEILKWAIKKG